jgi:DNA-binding MarR family transcriptional regulator
MIQDVNDSPITKIRSVDDGFCIPLGAEGRVGLMLARAGTALVDAAEHKFASVGIDAREYSVLAILQADSPSSQLELAKLLGKAPALVVASVDDLEARGLVERTRDPADRRRSRVTLTKAGEKTLAACDTLADEAVGELLPGLDADEIVQLRSLLSKGLPFGLSEWATQAR